MAHTDLGWDKFGTALNQYRSTNGWTCQTCNAFVQWHESHFCSPNPFIPVTVPGNYQEPWNTNPQTSPVFVDPNKEINDKLDEILKLLKDK